MKNYTEKKGFEFENLNVFFTFDPFADALATGKLSEKREIISRLYDLHQPFSAYAVNASVPGESGATIIQQVAYALAAGNEYLNFREVSGADMVEMAAKIHFRFNVAGSYFPEIAKFRAFRLLWEQILNAYDSNLAGNADTHIHASTAKWNKPRRDAYNNMIRSTTEAMSAAIGGCNHISVERFDKNWAPHSEFASRIARNSQLILQHESYLNKVADVGAGSYYVEKLTDEIALKSWELFQDIEKEGGLYEAVKSGWIQNLINEAKSRKIEAFRDKDEVIVGLNKYEPEESTEPLSDVGFSTADSLFEGDFEAVDSLSPFNIQQELK